jgi:hypothetical protein
MQSIQIDGIYTYLSNIKNLKIGDPIKLSPNPNNRLNAEAIGAYTLTGLKIGYVPFKSNQIDLKAKYIVTNIKLSQNNPILLISREFEQSNFIQSIPPFIELNNKPKFNKLLNDQIKHFSNYLIKSGNQILAIDVTHQDENFINLLIKIFEEEITFYTVTKKYYEENIFKYDEFYKFKLMPKCIYQPFQIHRLEIYLEKYYKSIDQLLKMRKFKLDSLIKSNIFESFEEINQINFGFQKKNINNLKLIKKSDISGIVYNHTQLNYLIQLIIQYNINQNEYYNPEKYLRIIHNNPNMNFIIKPKLDELINVFNNIKLGGLCYNHNLKYYCYINLYDDINIIDIWINNIITKEKFIELLIKLVISNKQIINLYNPIDGIIQYIEIPELIRNNILNIISK